MPDSHLFSTLQSRLSKGDSAVLATVCAKSGSTPRGAGARMLLTDDGFEGSVGGGSLERQVEDAMLEMQRDGAQAVMMDFALDGQRAADEGMICGGAMTVLLERLEPTPKTVSLFAEVALRLEKGHATCIEAALRPDGVARRLLESWSDGPPVERIAEDEATIILQRIAPQPRCLIFGGGHVGRATALLAHQTGFAVTLVDDRPDFADSSAYPAPVDVRLRDLTKPMDDLATTNAYMVIVTRGHRHDGAVLGQALKSDAGYIGMIGSRRKRDMLYRELRAQGASNEQLAEVRCPIGLDIGAQTPEEIAVSVVAEMIQFKAERERG